MDADSFHEQMLAEAEEADAFQEDYEYYRMDGCQCPEPFLCQGKCLK